MRHTRFLLLLLVLIASTQILFAQNKLTRAADDAYSDQMYLLALQKYQKAYSRVKNNKAERDRISYRIAECYRMMNNTKKAETAYKRLITNPKYLKSDPKVLLSYANMLKANGNYDEAIKQYKAYKELVPSDKSVDVFVESCLQAKEWIANPTKYDVKWQKLLNTKEDDFAAAYADKKFNSIIFTSDRNGAKGRDVDNWTGLGFSDFFFSRIDKKGDWSKPVIADGGGMINSKANDGVGQFNQRFSSFYFTRCWNDPRRKNGCAIFKVSRQGGVNWSEPEIVDLGGDSSTVVGHPSISSDESIYFSADLPGGYGGKDIWVVKKDKKTGKYLKKNLGPEINSPGDELFPFIRNDSILYFASNGHPGMGGLDIFVSTFSKTGVSPKYQWGSTSGKQQLSSISGATSYQWQSTGTEQPLSTVSGATSQAYQAPAIPAQPGWTTPENMRYPINSAADDFAIVFNGDESEQGLFSSNRPGGKGRDDIYSFVVPPVYFTLEGTITDDRTLQPVAGAKVQITGTNGRELEDLTDDKGHYGFNKMQIAANTTYDILVTRKEYFNEKGRETTVGLEKSKDLVRNFILRPIPKKPVVLPDILYDLAKWDLKPQYRDSLQGLIETLDANENLVIELASHTDSRDIDERNDILSQRRAQSVVDYLITRGIDPERLVARGYGERVPRTLTKDITREGYVFKTGTILTDSIIGLLPTTAVKEAAHQLNRRTEFSILRNDYIPKTKISKTTTTKIELVVKPEENNVSVKKTKEGYFEGTGYINGITTTFNLDSKEKSVYISPAVTLKLLKDGVIDKSSFEGDPTKILGEGTVADKAVVTLKEVRIGKNTVKELKATVNKKITTLQFGDNTLKLFGAFSIDETNGEIIFE
ncbi:MAG: OmpA family protein [Bacteroidales bacterium]|nr:OmpA family protein [Bacteroidales bacterium]HNW73780.1 OmpA family protein [Bacteroidales bacterium]HPS50504.1 OmpA family protein [Bacteroidales bacterium]